MLADEANMQKQKKREEQLRRWKENEESMETKTIEAYTHSSYRKPSKVRFPKSCVFLAACSSGDTDEVKQHLKLGVNINTTNIDGLTALHQACIDANIEMVKFLVENNADINAQDNEGWTPLHASVSVGNLEVVKYLISKNVKLNICNNDGDLPIDLCDTTNTQMKDFLEEEMRIQNIDVEYEKNREEMIMYEDAKEMNFRDKIHSKTGATPLHVSAAKGYSRVIKLLIQYGANVNALDHDGWTPLHAAAHWEQEEACRILSENGASFDVKNYSLQTPFEVCDDQMVAKLKILQKNSKNNSLNQLKDRLTDVTSLGNRLNRQNSSSNNTNNNNLASPSSPLNTNLVSDEYNKEKKSDKIVLSPVPVLGATDPEMKNTDDSSSLSSSTVQRDNDRLSFDKENINRSSILNNNQNNSSATSLNTITPSTNNQYLSNNEDQNVNKQQLFTKSNSLNKIGGKTGLHESLKSLSAQVKMKMDEDEINDKLINSNNSSSSSINSLTSMNAATAINSTTESNTNSTAPPNNTNSTRPNSDRRWGTSGQNETSTYKRRAGLNTNGVVETSKTNGVIPNSINLTPPTNINETTSKVPSPTLNPKDPLGHLKTKLIEADNSNRRYSSAPIASKDEQAELIRKQKAKLERHFRRSTQAVSYEDIKSAEATIKGNVQSPNVTTTQEQPNTMENANTSPIFTFNNISTTTQQHHPTPQGVSSLSTLFGEPKYKAISNPYIINSIATTAGITTTTIPLSPMQQTLTSNVQTSPTIVVNQQNSNSPAIQHIVTSSANLTSPISSPLVTSSTSAINNSPSINNSSTTTSNNNNNNNCTGAINQPTSTNESIEKDAIIANDIETDKLLNVIEKSKGFSDFNSTTRRLRNRANPFSVAFNSANLNNNFVNTNNNNNQNITDENDFNNINNNKKINKLIWNEERLELEFRNKEEEEAAAAVAAASGVDGSLFSNGNQSPSLQITTGDRNSIHLSPNSSLKRQKSANGLENTNKDTTIDPLKLNTTNNTNNLNGLSPTNQTRQMYRFGVNDANATYTTSSSSVNLSNNQNNSNSANGSASLRTAIKRSVSQVPTTERRPLLSSAQNINNTNVSSTQNGINNNNDHVDSLDSKTNIELIRKENEQLAQTVLRLQRELEEQAKKNQYIETIIDKREKRAIDRRISELEEEVKKVENLKQDNMRLKEENAALIRVISKLSK